MLAALLLALATPPSFRITHDYTGNRAKTIAQAFSLLETCMPDLLAAYGLALVASREVRLEPHHWCKAINADPSVQRPAFVTEVGADVIYLCDPFFRRKPEEAAVVLGHELLHVAGQSDAHDGKAHLEGSLAISARVRVLLRKHWTGRNK